ncbi:Glycosyl transferases group 1 [Candidatus Electrothrix marina]|uniref:Glycosyl transferases group 1 n=1 Tax=Candidatus Electrothrix marina TaxID=1859130 RepID=A0A3S3RW12_9BACT|nr:Glycosyl transferases group 1 [Candidatus Electrothrix marina]
MVYFPPNFNAAGDKIISEIEKYNVTYLPRFHTSFAPLLGQNREFKENKSTLRIFSGVRFLYKKFPRGNSGYNKGNDKIIKSLAYYYQENKNIKIDFVEKGTDLESAKKLCKKMGLEPAITWHKEMPFDKLTILYQQSDICFDQVGDHWIGAIGYYALWLGKPLIADDKKYIDAGCWPKDNPVCSASSIEEIIYWLDKLSDNDERKKISVLSKLFADKYIELDNHANPIFEV